MKTRLKALMCLIIALALLLLPSALADAQPERVVLSVQEEALTFDLAKTRSVSLTAQVEPAEASQRVTWASSDSSVARVSSSGRVSFRSRGTVTITATARRTKVASSVTLKLIDSTLPDSISLNCPSELSLERFETFQLSPTVLPATAKQTVQYKSSSGAVSVGRTDGLITAKRAGTATITCYSTADKKVLAEVKVTVTAPSAPEKILLTPDVTVVTVGDVVDFQAVRAPEDSCRFLKWKSSAAARGSITQDGVFTAKKAGSVTITCTSMQNSRIRATRKILIVEKDAPLSITLNRSEMLLHPTETFQLTASVLPETRNTSVAWRSSSSRVQVTQDGLITAKKTGTATITCYSRVNRNVLATVRVKVENLPAPESIDLSASPATVQRTEQVQLIAKPVPAGHSAEFTFTSSDRRIATVTSSGLVTGLKRGETTITVTSVRNRKVVAKLPFTVTDGKSPDSISAEQDVMRLEVGDSWQAKVHVAPETAVQGISWRSSSSRVASVDKNGLISAHRAGTAIIYAASTYDPEIFCPIRVVVYELEKPRAFSLSSDKTVLRMDETARLTLKATPEDASRLCDYEVSSDAVSVSRDGVVTPKKLGEATITAVSRKDRKVYAKVTVTVYDPLVPISVTLSDELLYLDVGNAATLTGTVFPATAPQNLTWTSSNTGVVRVDETGRVTAVGAGTATVRASAKNGVYAACTFAISSVRLTTVIPARTTDVSGIPANLQKIDAIRASALSQIINLAKAGVISYSESISRQKVIDEVFKMQAFPWMTPNYQRYWTVKYPEKSYQPGKVYYGLPYIQRGVNNGPNRQYNVDKALAEKRYVDSGKGYYLLNQDNLLDGLYVGCDCSSFVSMAYWGLNSRNSYLRTKYMALATNLYKNLDSYDDLRTGDMLLCSDNHVVMFLYWVDSARTKMMIIEQGGDGNTVICSIQNAAKYQSLDPKLNYLPVRLATYAQK